MGSLLLLLLYLHVIQYFQHHVGRVFALHTTWIWSLVLQMISLPIPWRMISKLIAKSKSWLLTGLAPKPTKKVYIVMYMQCLYCNGTIRHSYLLPDIVCFIFGPNLLHSGITPGYSVRNRIWQAQGEPYGSRESNRFHSASAACKANALRCAISLIPVPGIVKSGECENILFLIVIFTSSINFIFFLRGEEPHKAVFRELCVLHSGFTRDCLRDHMLCQNWSRISLI